MLGIVAKPASVRTSIRQTRDGRKTSKNPEAYFVQSKKQPEINDRKINRGTILPEELERGSRVRLLRLKIFLRRPDCMALPEMASSKAKHTRYIKIKGWANGSKGTIKSKQTTIAFLFLSAIAFHSKWR
jgi:hypothetical protein